MDLTELFRIARFLVVGLFNTAVGYSLFLLLFFLAGAPAELANFIAYAIAITLAFFLYRRFVFNTAEGSAEGSIAVYFLSSGAAYLLNLAVLIVLTRLGLHPAVAQIGAMIAYSVSLYLLNKFVVFRVAKPG